MTENSNGSLPTDTLKTIKQNVKDAAELLRSQRRTLQQRGATLPSDALDNLRRLRRSVDLLGTQLADARGELSALRALADNTALINSEQNTDAVLEQVMDTVIALTGAERGYIMLKNPDTGVLEFRVARGMDQSTLEAGESGMIISKTIVNHVAETGEPIRTDNAAADERYQSQESIVGLSLRSILAVPLVTHGETIGVVYCDNRLMSGLFKQHELEILTVFANQAAVAIENARLFESVSAKVTETQAVRDRMNNLFTSIASGVITLDENDRLLLYNAVAASVLPASAVPGQALRDVLPAMPQIFWRSIEQVSQTGQQQKLELPVRINGQERYWSVIVSALRENEHKRSRGITIVFDDVTDQKASETRLLEARRYLPAALVKNMQSVDMSDVGSHEREITALFADVRGFTSFSEKLEPEELMTVINQYLSLASDAIGFYEGIVDKYMGDAVTGLWNTQLNPQADHATRAVQAAMNLVMDLHAHHETLPADQQLYYGIGIHSGPAVLGNVGGPSRKEFAALGEATDVCKYLQEQAGPGEIIISEATRTLIADQFETELVTDLARPKAGYEHVRCYRVTKRKKGVLSSFVDEELLALLGDLDD